MILYFTKKISSFQQHGCAIQTTHSDHEATILSAQILQLKNIGPHQHEQKSISVSAIHYEI